MTTFVVAHGAWSAGWAWRKMHPVLGRLGHQLWTPTWTGIGERHHLASPQVCLSTHIDDLVHHMEVENHRGVVLIAHSYGGMVATGAMPQLSSRVRSVIFLDAVLPDAGCSMLDMVGADAAAHIRAAADATGDGWRVPANPMPPDTSEDDLAWIAPRRVTQPLATFAEAVATGVDDISVPRSYIYCRRAGPGDMFGPFAARAKANTAWAYREIDASHSPNITAPDVLAGLLVELADR